MGVVLTIKTDSGAELDYVYEVSSVAQAVELMGEALSLGANITGVRVA